MQTAKQKSKPEPPALEKIRRLTKRQEEIAGRIWASSTDKEIAAELGISVRTVSGHVSQVLRRLGVRGRGEIILIYERAYRQEYARISTSSVPPSTG